MKKHTTNYINTFIEIAEDSNAVQGEIPPAKKEGKSIANIQFEMISQHPYQYDSDDIVFECFRIKNDLLESEIQAARERFFSKGQACLRCSPLTKRYGWGIHSNEQGKVALYGRETEAYQKLVDDENLKLVKAMRSSRK